jgi:hypothetical protein
VCDGVGWIPLPQYRVQRGTVLNASSITSLGPSTLLSILVHDIRLRVVKDYGTEDIIDWTGGPLNNISYRGWTDLHANKHY